MVTVKMRMAALNTGINAENPCSPARRYGMSLVQSVIRASAAGPMSIEAFRSAFMAAGKGVLRLRRLP
jgi:hypothetical protein